jgi:hypothetical protein
MDPATLGPPAVPPSENRARCYRAASELLDYDGKADNETLRGRGNSLGIIRAVEADPEAVRAVLDRNHLSLELVAAAAERTASDWEIDYEKGLETRLPNLLELIELSRLVAAQAALQLHDGDTPAAVASIEQGLMIGSTLRSEDMLLTQVVGISIEREMTDVMRAIVASGTVDDEGLGRLKAMVALIPGDRPFQEALKGETTAMHMAVADISAGARSEVMDPEPLAVASALTWAIRPAVRRAHSVYLEEMDHAIARQTTPRWRREPADESESLPWYSKVFAAAPKMEGMILRMDQASARKALAFTALTLVEYRRKNGAYPATLAALVPGSLSEVPVDPFTGKPFAYAVQEEGFTLRSAGEAATEEPAPPGDQVLSWEILS